MRDPITGKLDIQQVAVPLKTVSVAKDGQQESSALVAVWENLRVAFYTDYILNDENERTCYVEGARYRVGNPVQGRNCGGNIANDCYGTCTRDMVIRSGTRDYLMQNIVDWCSKEFARMLRVQPVQGNLVVGGGTCGASGGVRIPEEHSNTGIPNADVILYVTARPTPPGVLGWAVPCQEASNGRAIAGHVNISPSIISDTSFGAEFQRGIIMHEIMHVLGFSSSRFGAYIDSEGNRRGVDNVRETFTREYRDSTGGMFRQSYNRIISPKVREVARDHFGCASAPGVTLEEYGGEGTAGSHWDKLATMDDIMIGAATWFNPGSNFVVSKFTLALFEDSGWYKPNYEYTDYDTKWGLGTGCALFEKRCEDWNLNQEGYFCTEKDTNLCTFNLRSKGYCGLASYTKSMGYFEHIRSRPREGGLDMYAEYCPMVYAYSNSHCDVSNVADGVRRPGEHYGEMAACFDSNIVETGDREPKKDVRCLEYKCTATHLEFRVGDQWFACPQSQEKQTIVDGLPNGFKGYVTCPKNGFKILCTPQVPRAQGGTGPRSISDKPFPGSSARCFFFNLFCVSAATALASPFMTMIIVLITVMMS